MCGVSSDSTKLQRGCFCGLDPSKSIDDGEESYNGFICPLRYKSEARAVFA